MCQVRVIWFCLPVAILFSLSVAAQGGFTYPSVVIADSPISYWRLGENGGETAYDSMASDNDLGVSGSVTLGGTAHPPFPDNAGSFSGGYLEGAGADFNFNVNDPFSVEAWIRTTNPGGNIAARYSGSGTGAARGWFFAVHNQGQIYFQLQQAWNAYAYAQTIGADVDNGAWNHVVGTYSGGGNPANLKLYINGTEVTNVDRQAGGTLTDITNTNYNVQVGQGNTNLGTFRGDMDEVAIYGSVLSAAQIANHYAVGIQVPEPSVLAMFATGLIGLLAYAWRRRR